MIHSLRTATFAFLTAVLLGGCNFDQPLTSTPSKDINTWLLGVWEYQDAKKNTFRAVVTPLTGDRYDVVFEAPGKSRTNHKRWHFEAWISRVGKSTYLTLNCLDSNQPLPASPYAFVHYQVISQNAVIIRPLELSSPSNATSMELRKEVRDRQKEGTLLPMEGTLWKRVSEVYWAPPGTPQPFQPLRYPPETPKKL